MKKILFLIVLLSSAAFSQLTNSGTVKMSGNWTMGAFTPNGAPQLPLAYANNLESVPPGAWDVTKTIGIDYASTGAGLQQALTDWCNASDQWWHVINPHTNVIAVTALMTRSEEHTSELQSLRHLVC